VSKKFPRVPEEFAESASGLRLSVAEISTEGIATSVLVLVVSAAELSTSGTFVSEEHDESTLS
jgi:hypothetical protein